MLIDADVTNVYLIHVYDYVGLDAITSDLSVLQNLDWDSEKTFVYHCHIDPDGSYTFKVCYSSKAYKLEFIFKCSLVFYLST